MEMSGVKKLTIMVVLWLFAATGIALAKTYMLTDGTTILGEPVSMNDEGVQFKADDETLLPRTPWDKLTPAALRQLDADAKTPHDKALLAPLVDYLPEPPAERKEITVRPITPPVRPTGHLGIFALFGSPVGLAILLVLYGATIFAAYEVAIYRAQPVPTVCGLAAIPFLGVLSPILYLAMPGRPRRETIEAPAPAETSPIPVAPVGKPATVGAPAAQPQWSQAPAPSAPEEPEPAPAPAARFPEPIVFTRGEFMFNRRFFETKFAGFFRMIPTEAEKDLVLLIKSSRGEFVGRHITRATPTEVYLQVFKNGATADEMIPFVEVLEVQIRHKDSL